MALNIDSNKSPDTVVQCFKCGCKYTRKKPSPNYLTSNAEMYKGAGWLPYCTNCLTEMYRNYYTRTRSPKDAVRQMCRKLDLYWSVRAFNLIGNQLDADKAFHQYLRKISIAAYAGKSYEDTLKEEGTLWEWSDNPRINPKVRKEAGDVVAKEEPITEEEVSFWGPGFTKDTYVELTKRYEQWTANLGELDPAEQAIYRQICILESTINKDSAAGKPIDKHVNALNQLLGSANLKPAQKKAEDTGDGFDTTPFGVWISRWENDLPIPEPDPEFEDVDNIVRYIEIWFKGHLSKMVGLKNSYSKMYEDEIGKLRVERPEFEDDDDEAFFVDIFSKSTDED